MISNNNLMRSAGSPTRRKGRRLLSLGAASIVIASTAGSGGGGVRVDGVLWPKYTAPAHLTVWSFGGEPDTDLAIKAFEKVYPNVKVTIQDVGGAQHNMRS